MENSEEIIKKRKEKIIEWIKDPYNLVFVLIFLVIVVIRLYYFFLTKNQPLWWDESQYMSGAKSIAGIVKYDLGGPRLPFYSIIMSVFFFLGINSEPFIRFISLLIPSLIVVLLTYLCIKEMYSDKRIALISTAIFGVLWEHLFYSNRFHTENLSLLFLILATWIFFRCYIKKQNLFFIKTKYSLLWVILFSFITVLIRPGNILALPALFLFWVILNKSSIFTKKGIILSISLIIIFIISIIYLPKISFIKPFIDVFYLPGNPIAWKDLSIFQGFYESVMPNMPPVLLYGFIAGIIIFLIALIIFLMEILLKYAGGKSKGLKTTSDDIEFKSDIFSFILILTVLSLFIFLMRLPTIEYRWFFPLLIGMLVFTSKGLMKIPEYVLSLIGMKNKKIILVVIIILTALGVYNQYLHADMIIKMKVNSYEQVKDAGLWLKDNSNKEDLIVSASQPQITYYSERETQGFMDGVDTNETVFEDYINKVHPKYFLLDSFQPSPKWAYDWPQRHNETVTPLKGYYFDAEQKQIALIIYEIKY